eukprot:XP_004944873.1 alpha-1B adrenergic receptor isoform X1 [Gallus gallus]
MSTYLAEKSNSSILGYLKVSALNSGNLSANSSNETTSNLDSPTLDISRAITVGLILGAFILFAIIGNILVILSVACNRHLRIPTNYFIINLAIADLLLSFTVLPFSATLEILGYWVLGRIFCDIWAAVDVLCCTASILSLCAISIDRYIGVRYSLQYPTLVTRRRAILALLGVWVLSMVISIGPLLGWKEPAPKDDKECRITEEPFYALFSSLGSFYIPLIVILVMYCRVYIVAKRTTKNLEAGVMKEMSNSKELTLRIHYRNIHEDTLNSNKSKGHNSRNSLALKLLKFSREKKAAKTLGIVVGMFILCWLPFFIVLPLGALDCSNYNLLTHQCRATNYNISSASDSRLDIYLHCSGRLLPQPVFFMPYVYKKKNQPKSYIHICIFKICALFHSVMQWLHNGVSRVALDF